MILMILIIVVLSWLLFTGKLSLMNTQEVNTNFSQFISAQSEDEYVIARLVSNEEFSTETYNELMGFPVGNSDAKLALVAHYKYYIKLAELSHHVENGVVFIHVPKLYLSTPVAFEFSTVREMCHQSLFGTNCTALLKQLKKEVSLELATKGNLQIGVIYDKAAKALADNLNHYFNTSGYGRYYKSMVVIFSSERNQSQRQFNYNDGFCGKEPCTLELDLGKGRIFTVNPPRIFN
jgi:hypothetical protein